MSKKRRTGCSRMFLNLEQKCDTYERSAVDRNIDQCLTKWQMKKLFNSSCIYCGKMSNMFDLNGIDRIDSNKRSYDIENVTPCCKTCNFMKGTLDLNTFLDQCEKIAKRKEFILENIHDPFYYHHALKKIN